MLGGITFRQAIDNNKKRILQYLADHGKQFTREIYVNYSGEKDMSAVRKALNELKKEGKVTTDDKVTFWRGKAWELANKPTPSI